MDRLGGYYVKWNKSDREIQILYDLTYMWNRRKLQKQVIVIKKKQTYRYREQTSVCSSTSGDGLGVK